MGERDEMRRIFGSHPPLNLGKRSGGEPADESEHFIICGDCGQAIDCRDLGEVFRHEECRARSEETDMTQHPHPEGLLGAYPEWICIDCGVAHGHIRPTLATFHVGDKCGWCGRETETTEPRDFAYPKPLNNGRPIT